MRAGLRRNRRGLRCPGKPRDRESGLDDFGFRSYSKDLGRWSGPDQPFADSHIENPQSWNLFTYCRNNPPSNIDLDGKQNGEIDSIAAALGRGDKQWVDAMQKPYLAFLKNISISLNFGIGKSFGETFRAGPITAGMTEQLGNRGKQPVLFRSYSVGPVTITDSIPARKRTEITSQVQFNVFDHEIKVPVERSYWEPDPAKSYATTSTISVGGLGYDKYSNKYTLSWGIGPNGVISIGINVELAVSDFIEDLGFNSSQKISTGCGNKKFWGKSNTD